MVVVPVVEVVEPADGVVLVDADVLSLDFLLGCFRNGWAVSLRVTGVPTPEESPWSRVPGDGRRLSLILEWSVSFTITRLLFPPFPSGVSLVCVFLRWFHVGSD